MSEDKPKLTRTPTKYPNGRITEGGHIRHPDWTPRQIRFVISQIAQWVKKSHIYKMITDSEAEEKYNIEIWTGTEPAFYRRVRKIEPFEIEIARREYLENFSDIPLAHKKERVIELIKMMNSIPEWITILGKKGDGVEVFNQSGIDEKRKLLKEIRLEMGEEAWQDAIKRSGTTKYSEVSTANLLEAFNDHNGHPRE